MMSNAVSNVISNGNSLAMLAVAGKQNKNKRKRYREMSKKKRGKEGGNDDNWREGGAGAFLPSPRADPARAPGRKSGAHRRTEQPDRTRPSLRLLMDQYYTTMASGEQPPAAFLVIRNTIPTTLVTHTQSLN